MWSSYNHFDYSTNCNTIQIWSRCSRYLSSVGNRHPAIYVASYVLNVTTVPFEIKFARPSYYRDLGCFVISLLNNKTIILLNRAEYRLILSRRGRTTNSQCDQLAPRWLDIAQVIELFISIAELMSSNVVQAWIFFRQKMYPVSIEFYYKSTSVLSRMLFSDWLRYSSVLSSGLLSHIEIERE